MVKRRDLRRVYFIERKFQAGFILKFCVLVIIGSLLTGVLVYFLSQRSTTVVFEHSRALVKSTADFLLPLLIQTIIVVSAIVAASTIILTLFISHKIFGPLYHLKKALSTIEAGDLTDEFSLRKDDQLQDVAVSMSAMVKALRDKVNNLKHDWQAFKDNWQSLLNKKPPADLQKNIEGLENIVVQIDGDVDFFKT